MPREGGAHHERQAKCYKNAATQKGVIMIDEVHISNVALIRDATFEPSSHLTVITGETGSGKTALLNALRLLIGDRAESSLVREGEEELRVEGRFFGPDSPEDGDIVVRRMGMRGRSRVTLNGSMASVKQLTEGIGQSVDLCGQHEHQRLLKPANQRELFDLWGAQDIDEPLQAYQAALAHANECAQEVARLQELEAADDVALDRARFAIDQIDAVGPTEGEYEALLEEMPRYEHAETLMMQASFAQQTLAGSDGVMDQLDQARMALDKIVKLDSTLSDTAAQVSDAYYTLEEAARMLSSYRDSIEFSPEELEAKQERLSALQGLMRGFGPRMEDVFSKCEQAYTKLHEYSARDELIAQARAQYDQAEHTLAACAEALAQARSRVFPRFAEAVNAQIKRLEMGTATLSGAFETLPREKWSNWGSQSFEFTFSPGEGLRAQPLTAIASGGELSRVMLALKVVLGDVDAGETLVFDEIDAGVGGQTAVALAHVLADLARTHQVIVVTHLAQVAVMGDVHYVVTKTDEANPETHIERIEGSAKEQEIARMLSGEMTDVSLEHAREMISAVTND